MFDTDHPLMPMSEAKQIVRHLNDSTILISKKDEAVRRVMSTNSAFYTLSRTVLAMMCEYMYAEYMEDKEK